MGAYDYSKLEEEFQALCSGDEAQKESAWWDSSVEEDVEEGEDTEDEFAPPAPHFGVSGGQTDGADDEEGDDDDSPVAPGQFRFVTRPVSWKAPDGATEEELISRYKKTRNPSDLEGIFAHNQDFLRKQVKSLESFRLPSPALKGMVYSGFTKAVERFDPSRGANLRTFYKRDQGLNIRRWARTNAQFTKAERSRVSKAGLVRQLEQNFELEEGRPPSSKEIFEAAEGAITLKDVKSILQESRRDLLGSKRLDTESDVDATGTIERALRRTREFYPAKHKEIIDHLYGLNGREYIPSNSVLAKKFAITPQHLSNFKQKLRADLQEEMRRLEAT